MGRLPLKPRAPGTELTRTLQVPVLNQWQGQTAPIGDDSIAKAVAALPFVPVGVALVQSLPLPLKAYAWLRAELSLWPDRSDEILPRYHVANEAALRALEECWEISLAASPEARATFDKHLVEYMAWLRTHRGSAQRSAFGLHDLGGALRGHGALQPSRQHRPIGHAALRCSACSLARQMREISSPGNL